MLALRRLLEPRERRLEALAVLGRVGAAVEVGLLVEHVLQQQPQRRAGARVGLHPRQLRCRRRHRSREVAVEAVEVDEQADRLGVRGQARELRRVLLDERARQRAVAVQPRGALAATGRFLGELEGDLGAAVDLRLQPVGRLRDELRERCLQLA